MSRRIFLIVSVASLLVLLLGNVATSIDADLDTDPYFNLGGMDKKDFESNPFDEAYFSSDMKKRMFRRCKPGWVKNPVTSQCVPSLAFLAGPRRTRQTAH